MFYDRIIIKEYDEMYRKVCLDEGAIPSTSTALLIIIVKRDLLFYPQKWGYKGVIRIDSILV